MKTMNYSYIVAANYKYTPELCAMLNSLDYVGNQFDVYLIAHQLPSEMLEQFEKLSYKVIVHEVTEDEIEASGGLSEVLCRKRYWYAAKFGEQYASVCILDADLIWVRNPWQFFDIASETGFILGPSKEQNKKYDDPHHKFKGEWILPEGYYNHMDLCNCPVFLDAAKWGEALRKSWEWFITGFPETNMKCPDMDAMNIAFIEYGSADETIVMPAIQWLGTNEQHLKPYIRAIEDHGLLKTECGFQIFSYHGQYYKDKWRKTQLENRHHCAEGYLKTTECPDSMANSAMDLLYSYFNKMLDWKIRIKKEEYL